MRIKICGVTRVEDAVAVAGLGADAIGLNFWPGSPRHVGLAQARQIVQAVRGAVTVVGLFVDAGAEELARVRREVALDVLQLHGEVPPDVREGLGADEYWKAVHSLDELGAYSCRTYVLDATVPGVRGGTGVEVDRALAREAARRAKVMLAGGLRPETVGAIVRDVRPEGVDVASGVERAPGVKDLDRVAAFVRAVRAAAAERA